MDDLAVKTNPGVSKLIACVVLLFGLVPNPLVLDDWSAAQSNDQASRLSPQTVVAILVEFPDMKHEASRESVHDLIFASGRSCSVNAYYTEASYNLTWVMGEATRDWIMMVLPFSSYGDMGFDASWDQRQRLVRDAVRAADDEVDFRAFTQVIVVVPKVKLIGYASDKWKIASNDGVVVNRATVQREDRPASVFAHEMGHSLGLRDMYDHALASKLGSSDAGAVYMGIWDLMSMGFRGCVHFSSYNKINLGWIPRDHVEVVQIGQVITVAVDPLEMPSKGVHVVKIPVESGRYYLVEGRRRMGFDIALPDEGVLVTEIDESVKGDGFARIQDANPDTSTLDDGTFDARSGKNPIFSDFRDGMAIMVLCSVGSAFKVHITTTAKNEVAMDAWRVVRETNNTIQEAQDEGRLLGLEEARSLLKKAVANFSEGDYEMAENLSGQARLVAEKATKPTITTTTLVTETAFSPATTITTDTKVTAAERSVGGVFTVEVVAILGVALLVITAGIFYLRRREK